MKQPNRFTTIFYSLVVLVVFVQVAATLFHSAVSLTHHAQYNSLEKEKVALTNEIQQLQVQLAEQSSLQQLADSEFGQQFVAIDSIVTAQKSDTLAAIQ